MADSVIGVDVWSYRGNEYRYIRSSSEINLMSAKAPSEISNSVTLTELVDQLFHLWIVISNKFIIQQG